LAAAELPMLDVLLRLILSSRSGMARKLKPIIIDLAGGGYYY
jgi:hypothetical protein